MRLMEIEKSGGILTLDRILSGDCENEFKRHFEEAADKRWRTLVVDFGPVDYFTSGGAGVLVKISALGKKHKVNLIAAGLRERYREIFAFTGLDAGFHIVREKPELYGYLLGITPQQIEELFTGSGKQYDIGWAPHVFRLHVAEKPPGAMNKNVNKRLVTGPLQGFGPMWEKTYQIKIEKPGLQAYDVMDIMKQHLPEFQPAMNVFYPSAKGITAGEIVLIDSATPGGIVSTGVLVLYADELSFTLMTPQGHPESGWVTFSARQAADGVEMQIQGLARASDLFFELAFRAAGSKFQEFIWTHVLSSLAAHLQVKDDVKVTKNCLADDIQWSKSSNLWFNSQIRSLPYNIPRLFKKKNDAAPKKLTDDKQP